MDWFLIKDRVIVNVVGPSDTVPPLDGADRAEPVWPGAWVGDSAERAYIIDEIKLLEARQPRAVREAILTGDNSRVRELDDQIAALRAQLNAQ